MTDAELVREVAEKVMKAKDIVFTPFGECHIIDKDNIWMTFDPIHDPIHAFMVVERMREKGWKGFRLERLMLDEKYSVEFWKKTYSDGSKVYAYDTIGRAVLLAAKAALEE